MPSRLLGKPRALRYRSNSMVFKTSALTSPNHEPEALDVPPEHEALERGGSRQPWFPSIPLVVRVPLFYTTWFLIREPKKERGQKGPTGKARSLSKPGICAPPLEDTISSF